MWVLIQNWINKYTIIQEKYIKNYEKEQLLLMVMRWNKKAKNKLFQDIENSLKTLPEQYSNTLREILTSTNDKKAIILAWKLFNNFFEKWNYYDTILFGNILLIKALNKESRIEKLTWLTINNIIKMTKEGIYNSSNELETYIISMLLELINLWYNDFIEILESYISRAKKDKNYLYYHYLLERIKKAWLSFDKIKI